MKEFNIAIEIPERGPLEVISSGLIDEEDKEDNIAYMNAEESYQFAKDIINHLQNGLTPKEYANLGSIINLNPKED